MKIPNHRLQKVCLILFKGSFNIDIATTLKGYSRDDSIFKIVHILVQILKCPPCNVIWTDNLIL